MNQPHQKLLKCIEPLLALEGKWIGSGKGSFPSLEPFIYREESNFGFLKGQPYLQFSQKAWITNSGNEDLIHWETGIISATTANKLKFYTCHMNGRVEIYSGFCNTKPNFNELIFTSEYIKNAYGLKTATSSLRVMNFNDKSLEYKMSMCTKSVKPLVNHLNAKLQKT